MKGLCLCRRFAPTVDLVAWPQPQLANETLAHMNVAVGWQIPGIPPAKKSAALACQLQDAEHQRAAAAADFFIRWRMAVSP